jgi:cytosine deaminase
MTLFRRARIPVACLPATFASTLEDHDRRFEPWIECDLTIDGPAITSVTPSAPLPTAASSSPAPATPTIDLGGHLVFPGLIDVHTHLDKTHTWPRAPNPTGEFWDAIKVLHADSAHWTAADLHTRAGFALRQAWAHGTTALRTHLDSSSALGETSHAVMAELRAEWADRLTLQTVSLCNVADFSAGAAARITRVASTHGASALGGFPQPNPDLARQLDYLLAAARDLGLGLDLHVDESGLPHAECLRATAEAVLRNEFPYPVACGHCCSLAVQDPARAASTIDLVKAAGITVIALPLCNLYLQHRGRHPSAPDGPRGVRATPFWRGLTLVHELIAAGVPVAAASDNVRDAFFAWGDYDALEVLHQSIRIGHLDTRLDQAPALVTTTAADAMGLPHHGRIAPGARADLVVTTATTFNEFLARPAAPRRLLSGESFRDPTQPPYTDLP